MARYISQTKDLAILRNNGKIAHKFENGVLVTPSAIDFTAQTDDGDSIQLVYALDLSGATTSRAERAGQGRNFFEAPIITPGADTLALVAGTRYVVTKGTVTYDGVAYTKGQYFIVDGTEDDCSTSNGGEVSLAIPMAYEESVANQFQEENFIDRHTGTGDEATYSSSEEGGYTPNSGGFGWVRTS